MATALRYPWDEPRPRSRIEEQRLASLQEHERLMGADTPIFRRSDVMELAGLSDADWSWAVTYNKFVTGTEDPRLSRPDRSSTRRAYRLFSVREVRALRMAKRLRAQGVRNHLIKVYVNQYLNRPPVQATFPVDQLHDYEITRQIANRAREGLEIDS